MSSLSDCAVLRRPAQSPPCEPLIARESTLPTLAGKENRTSGCAHCGALRFCLPEGLAVPEAEQFDHMIGHRIRMKKGSALFHAADPLVNLYAVRIGAFKTTLVDEAGRGQITGFHMPGDVLGLDGIAEDIQVCTAVALEDSELCVIPYARLMRSCASCLKLQNNFNRLLSQALVREQNMLLTMAGLRADQRLAAFFLKLSERFARWGYSDSSFVLRMSREDIASYLGLRLETVCRCIAQLRARGIIECRGRTVEIRHMQYLKEAACA